MYKIIKNDGTELIVDKLKWVKHQTKNDLMILCDESEGDAILSPDQSEIYNVNGKFPIKDFEVASVEELNWYPIVTEQDLNVKLAMAELVEQQINDKTETQLALAELIESIMGGGTVA